MIVPQTHNQDHTAFQGLTHGLKTTLLLMIVHITKEILDIGAEIVGDGVIVGHTIEVDLGVFDHLSVLNVLPADFHQISVVRAIIGDELGDHSHRLGAVHLEAGSLAEEGGVAHAVRGKVTTVLVAHAVVSVTRVVVSAILALTSGGLIHITSVGGVGLALAVGFPQVHLHTTGSKVTESGVLVIVGGHPILHIGLAVDPLHVMGTLGITITGSKLSSSLVGGVLAQTAVLLHLHKVEGTIQTAIQLGGIHVEGSGWNGERSRFALRDILEQILIQTPVNAIIIDHHHHNGQFIANDGFHLHATEAKGGIAFNADHPGKWLVIATIESRSDRKTQSHAHGSERAGIEAMPWQMVLQEGSANIHSIGAFRDDGGILGQKGLYFLEYGVII
ncbi:hypothetical protein TCAL_15133 [Tigriopus californicus]|uniref:Uncharacterized protein n=1 Tax=Tigriopus californicus TaxID=6832 RepID=A0A553NVE7_TIGCA|nr:hypothetical protein TCAL_15133 [Tigriopus californicus]